MVSHSWHHFSESLADCAQEPGSYRRCGVPQCTPDWKKYIDFNVTVKVQGEILDELIQEGHQMIPSQWIETDKKAHLKRPGFEHLHEPEFKSRLVACGHVEDAEDIRADSLTCSTEGFNLICSFAACRKLRLKSAD